MNIRIRNRLASVGATALLIALCSSCVVPGDGQPSVGISYSADFYEPFGYEYGGWGPGYHVGPPRGGDHRPSYRGGSTPHNYRPAPPSRPVPSIPRRQHSSGSRSH
jgi:hypothetical protein